MSSYKWDFNSCAIRDGFCKSSHTYSTLVYIEHQAKKLNIPTLCITFIIWKEPLYKDKL